MKKKMKRLDRAQRRFLRRFRQRHTNRYVNLVSATSPVRKERP